MRNQLIDTQKSLTKQIDELRDSIASIQLDDYKESTLETLTKAAFELQSASQQLRVVRHLLEQAEIEEQKASLSRSEPAPAPVTGPAEKSDVPGETPPEETPAESPVNEVDEEPEPQPEPVVEEKQDTVDESETTSTPQDEPQPEAEQEKEIAPKEEEKADETREEPAETYPVREEQSEEVPAREPEPEPSTKSEEGKIKLHLEPGFTDQLGNTPLTDLKAAVGLNERFLFANELFNGNMEAFNKALNELNHLESLADAERLINAQLTVQFSWDIENEAVERFLLLVKRRFAAKEGQ